MVAEATIVAGAERNKRRPLARSLPDKRLLCVAPSGSVVVLLPTRPEDRRRGVHVTSVPIGAAVAPSRTTTDVLTSLPRNRGSPAVDGRRRVGVWSPGQVANPAVRNPATSLPEGERAKATRPTKATYYWREGRIRDRVSVNSKAFRPAQRSCAIAELNLAVGPLTPQQPRPGGGHNGPRLGTPS